jgi:hypothetical protein
VRTEVGASEPSGAHGGTNQVDESESHDGESWGLGASPLVR